MNVYEYRRISNDKLPKEWQSQAALENLEEFLQQNWEQRSIFYEDNNIKTKQQFLDFVEIKNIRTKKYIGTIIYRGEQLNIYPRVFRTDKEDSDTANLSQEHMMFNLVKWLEYCNRLNYPFLKISSELTDKNNLIDFFITLYINYVRSAFERGLYYQYVDKTKDCTCIKGKFDVKDYLTVKIPNGQADKFKCTYSNFEYDNKVNRIIKYTCKQLLKLTSRKNQQVLRKILIRLNDVSDVVCSPNDCDNIRLSKMHQHFRVIISMSKIFLLNKVSNYSIDTNESFCFLFPTDMLFEGFIGGFIKDILSKLGCIVLLQESKHKLVDKIIYKGEETEAVFTLRHDILVEYNDKIFILDTKYKEITRFEDNPDWIDNISAEVSQQDLYQVLEYARKRNISDVYLLYPMYRYEEKEEAFPIAISESPSGNIKVHFIRLPFIFEENEEEKTTQQLVEVIKQIFEMEVAKQEYEIDEQEDEELAMVAEDEEKFEREKK